jgi:ribosomal protein L7/L12
MATEAADIEQLKIQVAHLTEQINGLYRHLGIGQLEAASLGSGEPSQEILDALSAGNLIMAIKLYREQTGVGLAEAKGAVEDIARQRGY